MSKPVAVIAGDVHFTVQTLDLATAVIKQCLAKAKELNVPLILNGDTLDSKAIIRGEVANRLIELLKQKEVEVIINVGNHDLLNEKGTDHSLEFLRPHCAVNDRCGWTKDFSLIGYQSNQEIFKAFLNEVPKDRPVIIHQGVMGADLGHYVQDKTSLPPETFAEYRVIASHYHKRQDIKCGRPQKGARGLFSYIGNPYTLTFGEANDGPKGFSVLMDDGMLEFVPTNLRKHKIVELEAGVDFIDSKFIGTAADDLVWVKLFGSRSTLSYVKKDFISNYIGHSNFKLDLIPTDSDAPTAKTENMTDGEILDSLIDTLGESDTQKSFLKSLWRGLVE
jgi:DNA repair exonuclease SbcCD nuclease subunit